MQRKPGGYRQPTNAQRDASRIDKDEVRSLVSADLEHHRGLDQATSRSLPPRTGHTAWCACSHSPATPSSIPSAGPARRWSRPCGRAATASVWRSIPNTAAWRPDTSKRRMPTFSRRRKLIFEKAAAERCKSCQGRPRPLRGATRKEETGIGECSLKNRRTPIISWTGASSTDTPARRSEYCCGRAPDIG